MKIDPEYQKLLLQIKQDGEKYADQQMQAVYSEQKSNLDELHKYLGLLYVKNSVDSLLNVTPAQKKTILADVDQQIISAQKSIGSAEVQAVSEILKQNYGDMYYKTAYVMDTGLKAGIKFGMLKKEYIDSAVNSPVDGEMFSDRIWNNKAAVADKLKQSFVDALNGDTTIDKIGRQIQQIFNVQAYDSQRLVHTENARVQSTAIDDIGKSAGCSQQMFCATLEGNTCSECAEYDGKYFDIDDDSKPEIPVHPNCRCVYINVPPMPGWTPQNRRNNETGEDIGFKDYAQWAADKGIKNDDDFENNIIGIQTSNGITVNALSQHFGQRSAERKVEPKHVVDALTNPLKVGKLRADGTIQFIGEHATVAINPDTGNLTTVWPTGSKKAAKLKGAKKP